MNSTVISDINPKSPVAEAFRIIRTNLNIMEMDKQTRTILITSPGPSEGKSSTVANLGTVLAQSGVKVIIVDCDLRRSEQHHIFGLANQIGLSNVLVDGLDVMQVLQETSVPNLRVIPSGPIPSHPAELLGSQQTKQLLQQLIELADVVLVDSPPILMVADAQILSGMVDGVVLVVKSGRTKVDAVKQAKERIEKANARIIGTVLNAVQKSDGGYYYGYSYYR